MAQMKFTTDLSKGILGKPDSADLWREILSPENIPDSVLLKPDFSALVVAAGHGTEAVILAKRMLDLGLDKDHVNNAITLVDKYNTFTTYLKQNMKFKNVITADFLGDEFMAAIGSKKFDVVVGNPPYQSPIKGDASLWPKFIKRAYELSNNFVAIVCPSAVVLPGPNIRSGKINVFTNYIRKGLVSVNIGECSRHFVGIGPNTEYFGYFVTSKNVVSNKAMVRTNQGSFIIDPIDFAFLPKRGNELVFSILKKIQKVKNSIGGMPFSRGGDYINNKSFGQILAFFKAQYASYEKCIHFDENMDRDFSKEITDFGWFIVSSHTNTENVMSVVKSKLYRFFGFIMEDTTFNQGFHNSLPYIDLSRMWTDREIYDHFGLTEEEIAYIEETIK